MQAFLDQVTARLTETYGTGISRICLVLPTRRAVLFLQASLARQLRQTFWAPAMFGIQDWVRQWSGAIFPEAQPLVFHLYQTYLELGRRRDPAFDEAYESFAAWGEMLLRDFDETDKYLIRAEKLFANIADLNEIDAVFGFEGEPLEAVQRFWSTLRGRRESHSEVQQRFLAIWEQLYPLYTAYRESLASQGLAYDGMAYRSMAEAARSGSLSLPWEQVVFIGFNALSKAEEEIFGHLLHAGKAQAFWDVDRAYLRLPGEPEGSRLQRLAGEEPGKFIAAYHRAWQGHGSHLIAHDMGAAPKTLYLDGTPLLAGQAQYLGNLMRAELPDLADPQAAVVVLADEQLLFPVLHALPENADKLNITMGLALRQTPLYQLLAILLRLLRNARREEQSGLLLSHRDLGDLLAHPLVAALDPAQTQAARREIVRQNLVYVPAAWIKAQPLPPLLHQSAEFPWAEGRSVELPQALLAWMDGIFQELYEGVRARGQALEQEYIFQFYLRFNQLRETLARYRPALSLRSFVNLMREALQKARVPFEGEPLEGLQLMGFLETRALDFRKVYILGANEGNLPDSSSGNSFIPYSLRRAFGLPTHEERDAIYAYHFYRLIQRAEEVHLVYNSVVKDQGGAGEVSRFVQQIRHYFRQHPQVKVVEQSVTTEAPFSPPPPIRVEASPLTQAALLRRPQFSATSLSALIECRLRFYFRYVAGIREPEEVEEVIESNTFGTLLHRALELVYLPCLGRFLEAADFEAARKRLEPALRQAFSEQRLGWDQGLEGRNILLRDALLALCRRLLDADAAGEPFKPLSLEAAGDFDTALSLSGQRITLTGALDRIDELRDGSIRIVDYKTGQIHLAPRDLDAIFSDSAYKAQFQGLLYAWLYRRRHPQARVRVGFYALRKLSEGIQYLFGGNPVEEGLLRDFESRLLPLMASAWEEDYPQTQDLQRCAYCPYRGICQRDRA